MKKERVKRERVQKFIALSGFTSRRKAEDLIKEERVKVNGMICKIGDTCLSYDEIKIDDVKITFDLDKKIYIVMNKPIGFVCSNSDLHNPNTIFDLILKKDREVNLFSVGRLDKDTTGLIIITNDGNFSQSVIHPSKKIIKTYEVKLDKELKVSDKKSIENGLVLDDYKLSNCEINILNEKERKYLISIFEGRKRQIRRVFEMKNYKVVELKRVSIGGLKLKDFNLKEGEYKIVSKKDLEKVFK